MIVKRLSLSFALFLPLVFAACGGDGLTLPPEGEPANITVMDGNGQSGRVGATLSNPLVVQVTDTRDRPVANATVLFSFSSAAAGEATPASATTDADGLASATLTLGSTPGTVSGKAEVPVDAGTTPVEASFTATALSDDANGIAPVSGDGQSAPVNTALPSPLVVEVTDQFGNPVPGVTISWTITGGGTVSEASTVTGSDGQSSVTRTLGGTAGPQATIATADGLAGSPVTFTHTATAGSATGVVKVSGDNQSGSPGAELTLPLVVQVLDALGNPIPNRAVTWVIGTGNGSVAPENTTTDAQGHASTMWTLGPAVGANTVNAVVSGVGTATFNATATAGLPSASNSTVSASPTTISAGGGSSTITVTVRDDANNPVSGASVAVSSTGSENTINPATVSSGSNGVATFTFGSTVAETKTITATAGGVAITDDATITVQKVSSTVEITSDEPDPSSAGEPITIEVAVSGSGGTPTGEVVITISGGLPTETCTATLSSGSGSCILPVTLPGTGSGNRRVITATYGGDTRFSGDTDTENHRVDPLPVANTPPTAAFNAPTDCVAGVPCQFTDASSDSDGTVQIWSWDFGSGGTSDQEDPIITFPTPGVVSVSLTVTDDDGATNSVTHDVNVAEPENTPPTASFTAPSCVAGTECQFDGTGTDTDGTIATWSWDFADPTSGSPTASVEDPVHNFASPGQYNVTLTVTDDDGAASTPHAEVVTVQ